jgi:hypothetical protein
MTREPRSTAAPPKGVVTAESATYPQRPSYFAHRYCRLLTKTCAAQDIGHIAFVLCVTIAHQEDAKRYKGPVTFYNGQLLPLVGVTKWETLANARQRAVDAGWLYYEPGKHGQRHPGRYWVTIPQELEDVADVPCDEGQYPAKGDREGDREGEHSTLTLNPLPKKKPASAGKRSFKASEGDFAEFWAAYPRRVAKKAALKAWDAALKTLQRDRHCDRTEATAAILEAAQAFAVSDKGRGDPQYIPYPTTWLNQGRYDDDRQTWTTNGHQQGNGRPAPKLAYRG